MLGFRFCARAFSSCGKQGPLFIVVRGPLTTVASLVAEHRLQTRRLSNCGSRAQLLRGMWDLPRPGLEPVSPALAGRFSTTAPPGKPPACYFNQPRRKPWMSLCYTKEVRMARTPLEHLKRPEKSCCFLPSVALLRPQEAGLKDQLKVMA